MDDETPRGSEVKRASWLELVFDLEFVSGISKTTHVIACPLSGQISLEDYARSALILVSVQWGKHVAVGPTSLDRLGDRHL